MTEYSINYKFKIESGSKEIEFIKTIPVKDEYDVGLYSSSTNHNPGLQGSNDNFANFYNETHIKYPLFYLINLRHLEKEYASKKVDVLKYFPLGNVSLPNPEKDKALSIRNLAVKLRDKWREEAIKSFQDAYSDFVRMRMTRVDRNGRRIDELMRKDDMEILPSLPSEKELFYEFVEIFNHRDLFNDYDKYDKRVNVNREPRLNWFEHLFIYQKDNDKEKKGDIRAEHAQQGDDFLGHKLKILNVRYFDHRSFYDVNRDNGVVRRYATWQSYMSLTGEQPNQIHRLLVDFIIKHRRKIKSSTNNSSFLVGKFQKAIHDVYIYPIAGIAGVLLLYKLICVVYHIIGKDENSKVYNVEKKILKFVGKGEGIWANDIWCVQHLFNKDGKIISNRTETELIQYKSDNPNPKENIWFKDLELKDGPEDNDYNTLEKFKSLSWRNVHRLVCICGNALALKGLRTSLKIAPKDEQSRWWWFVPLFGLMLFLFVGIIGISFSSATLAIDAVKAVTKDEDEENDEENDDGGFWSWWRENQIVWGVRIGLLLLFNVVLPVKETINYGALSMAWHVVQYQYSAWKYDEAKKYEMCSKDAKENHPYLYKFECKDEGAAAGPAGSAAVGGEPPRKGHEKKLPSKGDITFKAFWRWVRGKPRDNADKYVSTGDAWSYYGRRTGWFTIKLLAMFFFFIALLLYITIVIPLKKIVLYAYVFLYSDKDDIDGALGKTLACGVMLSVIAFCSWLLYDVMKYNNADRLTPSLEDYGADNKNVKLWESYLVSNYPEQKAHIDRHRFAALFASFKHYEQNTDSKSGSTVLGPFVWLFLVVAFYGLMFLIKKVKAMSFFWKLGEQEQKIGTGSKPKKGSWGTKKVIFYGGVIIIFMLVLSIWAMEYYGVYMRMKSDIEDKVEEEKKEFLRKNPEASFI